MCTLIATNKYNYVSHWYNFLNNRRMATNVTMHHKITKSLSNELGKILIDDIQRMTEYNFPRN